jgi:hypothetical protein
MMPMLRVLSRLYSRATGGSLLGLEGYEVLDTENPLQPAALLVAESLWCLERVSRNDAVAAVSRLARDSILCEGRHLASIFSINRRLHQTG